MSGIPFVREMNFHYGRPDRVSPLLRRVVAENPGPFTYTGTGTYIVGRGNVAVVDPGPLLESHLSALQAALRGETVTHILITHTHLDHSPLAGPLKDWCGASTYGFGAHGSGKAAEGIKVEEGGDRNFVPDVAITDGDVIDGDGWTLECVSTPGHTSNHMAFALTEERALLTGDHIMGWSTTVVSPPDGDMADYYRSLEKILRRTDETLWPTHGPPVREPLSFTEALIAHRHERERQILDGLARGHTKIAELVRDIYRDVDPRLHPAAALSVHAHLIHMVSGGRVICDGEPTRAASYRIA